jgi:tetraacyldisaccharide 4'-kinase
LYQQKFFRAVSFDIPVISIGNLSTGGTGKTPHVDYLINLLKSEYPIGVLSRGYRRKTSGYLEVIPLHTAQDVGDEPLLTKWKHPNISVAVSENRALGIPSLASDKAENFVVLLDDAFQHRGVKPGLNILLTPYDDLYINNQILPIGNLREFKSGAERADIVIVSHSPLDLDEKGKNKIVEELQLKPYQKLFFSQLQYLQMYQVFQQGFERVSLPKESKILLLTGIANNSKIKKFLESQFDDVYTRAFSDHYTYQQQDIESIITTYKDLPGEQKHIVTTEKDFTRLLPFQNLFNKAGIKVFCLPIKVNFAGEEKQKFNKTIRFFVERTVEEYLSDN